MSNIDKADTAWILVSTALVLLMTPALALFYGGLVRAKNVLSTFMHSFFALAIVSVVWVAIGYSLAFGPTVGGFIGGLDHVGLNGVGLEARDGTTIPHILFMTYQLMFAIITPALISGAFAERIKFSAYVVFTAVWSLLVYSPVAHWVWGPGGWLGARGSLDFAGGTVVHLTSGVSALVFALVIGPRLGYPKKKSPPHNLTMSLLGAGLLWFGWFGFNAGSALGSTGLAALALINTHLAAAMGAASWAAVEWLRHGKPSSLGVASGLVAGLVAITPAAGFVGPMPAIAIGALAGVVCYVAVTLKSRFTYDDALDAFGVHGVGGFLGGVLTAAFASTVWNPAGKDGLLRGGTSLMAEQLLALAVAGVYAAAVTYVAAKVIDRVIGLRAPKEDESEGLDRGLHGEASYVWSDGLGARPSIEPNAPVDEVIAASEPAQAQGS